MDKKLYERILNKLEDFKDEAAYQIARLERYKDEGKKIDLKPALQAFEKTLEKFEQCSKELDREEN